MQPFSPLLIAQADVSPLAEPSGQTAWTALREAVGLGPLLGLGVASIAGGILAIWVASLAVAGDRATLGRALKTWLSFVGLSIVLVIAGVIGFSFALNSGGGERVAIMALVFGVITLAALIGVPMAVYEIDVLRSVGWNVIHAVLLTAMNVAMNMVFPQVTPNLPPEVKDQMKPEVWRRLMATPTPSPAQVEAVRSALAEKQEVLKRRFEALEIRRKYLPAADPQAREDYERERAAYERDLERLRAEADAALPR